MASEKRKKNRVNQFGDHKVTFTVTVAKAFPSGNILLFSSLQNLFVSALILEERGGRVSCLHFIKL